MNLLIVKLSAIGDVVHALPFLEAIRSGFPLASIDWVVEEDAYPILLGHPALNRIIVSRRRSWLARLSSGRGTLSVFREISSFLGQLRLVHYDLVIDLQGLLKSGILVGLARGNRKIGMTGAREGGWLFLNEGPVPVDDDRHAIDRYLQVAEYLGCPAGGKAGRIPLGEHEAERIEAVRERYNIQGKALVAINPMAKWPTKLWEPDRFASLASRIQGELGREVVFTGSPQDRPVIERIMRMMPHPCHNLAGRIGLKELAYLYSRCGVLVTTDTGPMHMAAAMGCPVVALFGPTAPWRTGPYGKGHHVVRSGIACSPCFKRRCGHTRCMKEIGVDQVFDAVKKALSQTVRP